MQKPSTQRETATTAKRQSRRIILTMPQALLQQVDAAAAQEYTSRSDLIRTALLWYLQPAGRELDQTDPETVLKVLQQRHTKAAVKQMLQDQKN